MGPFLLFLIPADYLHGHLSNKNDTWDVKPFDNIKLLLLSLGLYKCKYNRL